MIHEQARLSRSVAPNLNAQGAPAVPCFNEQDIVTSGILPVAGLVALASKIALAGTITLEGRSVWPREFATYRRSSAVPPRILLGFVSGFHKTITMNFTRISLEVG